jgi:hypothetical protein
MQFQGILFGIWAFVLTIILNLFYYNVKSLKTGKQ